MTLDEIRASDKDVLTPKEVASVLRVDPQSIREADPVDLGFPVIKMGRRTLIPRLAFLAVMEGSG